MIAAAPVVGMLTFTHPAFAADQQVARLADTITNDSSDLAHRNDAAAQLVSLNSPEAIDQIQSILKNSNGAHGPIAIARALAGSPNANPVFIKDLAALLGPDATMTEVAANAMVHYDGHLPEVFGDLQAFADNNKNNVVVRAKAISAMGLLVDLNVAKYLIGLIQNPRQNAVIANAATDALGVMTGINSYQNNAQQWQQWWGSLGNITPDQFKAQVLEKRLNAAMADHGPLVSSVNRQLLEYYDLVANNPQKADQLLLSCLNDRSPDIRYIGTFLVLQPISIDKPVQQKLLTMISDPEAPIRLRVLTALGTVNNPDTYAPLLAQLKVEQNVQVKALLVQVLGQLNNPDATDTVLDLLHDKQPDVVAAAAKVVAGKLGVRLREKDPAKAAATSALLRKIVDDNTDVQGTNDMRAACVAALAALKDKRSFDFFMQKIQPGETTEVRRAGLRGLGNLGDTNANAAVAAQISDPNATVRLEAAEALKTVATLDQVEQIFTRMSSDPDKSVRDALWIAFFNLYAKQSPDDIGKWAGRLNDIATSKSTAIGDDVKREFMDHRIATLQKLGEVLTDANANDKVAQNQIELADVFMETKPPRTTEAIENLRKALSYYRSQPNTSADRLEAIIGALIGDELTAKQWTDATRDGADAIKINAVYQDTVGSLIKNKADDLVAAGDLDGAKLLIDSALKMEPPLGDRYIKALHFTQDQIKQKQAIPPG
jgi:HEAT repeat protein